MPSSILGNLWVLFFNFLGIQGTSRTVFVKKVQTFCETDTYNRLIMVWENKVIGSLLT